MRLRRKVSPRSAAGRSRPLTLHEILVGTLCFERGARKDTGGDGWADVWRFRAGVGVQSPFHQLVASRAIIKRNLLISRCQ